MGRAELTRSVVVNNHFCPARAVVDEFRHADMPICFLGLVLSLPTYVHARQNGGVGFGCALLEVLAVQVVVCEHHLHRPW